MPAMDPAHTMPWANAQDLALGAEEIEPEATSGLDSLLRTPASAPLVLPPARDGEAVRVVVDLGTVHNGWLAFEVCGRAGSRLFFSLSNRCSPGRNIPGHPGYEAFCTADIAREAELFARLSARCTPRPSCKGASLSPA
jgi:hypothetical protein